MKEIVAYLVVAPVALVIGVVIGAFIMRYIYEKKIKEWQKQMATPDKEQVRNMLSALGQKPSEEQVNRFINMSKKKEAKKTKKSYPPKKKNS